MVEGVTSAQFATFNEFPLSEQSRSWAAFSGRPLLKYKKNRFMLSGESTLFRISKRGYIYKCMGYEVFHLRKMEYE